MTARKPDDPIALLSGLLCDGDQQIAARSYGGRNAPAIAVLVQAGMLGPDGVIDTTVCDACGEQHLAEIESRGPDGGYGWRCPEAGFVTADPDAVAALSVVTNCIVAALGELFNAALGAGRWKPRRLDPTNAWILGAWSIEGMWTTVVLVCRLDSLGAARRTVEALAALPQNDAGLVLTAVEDAGFEAPLGFAVVPLAASLILDTEGRLSVDATTLARAIAPHAGARRVAHVGRPGVAAKVFAMLDVLEARRPSGEALNAGLVERAWPEFHRREVAPSRATLRRHISRWRSSRQTQSDL